MVDVAVPIETLSREDVENVLRRALDEGLQSQVLEDFLATVDWSNQDRAPEAIRKTLGLLEQRATEYAEDDLGEADYRRTLLALLSAATPST